jgi:hypothetical protein
MAKLTIAERTEHARLRVCPKCHVEAGRPCRGTARRGLRPPMKTVHAERLALIPKEVPDA